MAVRRIDEKDYDEDRDAQECFQRYHYSNPYMLDMLGPRGINISGQYVSVWLLHAGFGMLVRLGLVARMPRLVVAQATGRRRCGAS